MVTVCSKERGRKRDRKKYSFDERWNGGEEKSWLIVHSEKRDRKKYSLDKRRKGEEGEKKVNCPFQGEKQRKKYCLDDKSKEEEGRG